MTQDIMNGTTPIHQEGIKFRQELCVPCYQTDRQGLLKPSGFMDMAQEIAYWAAEALGFGYDSLHIHHTAWVMMRLHVQFLQPVRWRDWVSLFTWHKGASGISFFRDFLMQDAAGKTAIAATSSWVVIDERSRRIVKPEELLQFAQVEQPDHAIVEPAPKILLPKEMELAGEHTVLNTEIDINGHTNNACYVVWAMGCLPTEATLQPMIDLYVNFHKETKEGECVQLYRHHSDNTWYVEGRLDGKPCFSVEFQNANS
jgi:acyl-ACP thioesterase